MIVGGVGILFLVFEECAKVSVNIVGEHVEGVQLIVTFKIVGVQVRGEISHSVEVEKLNTI